MGRSVVVFILLMVTVCPSIYSVTITISAPSNDSTTITVSANGAGTLTNSPSAWDSGIISSELENPFGLPFDGNLFSVSGNLTASNSTSSVQLAGIQIDDDGAGAVDDFALVWNSNPVFGVSDTITFAGSATFSLTPLTTFSSFNVGNYDLTPSGESLWGFFDDESGLLTIQYSAVPDTGSTAALLGAGVVALAFARRRLG